MSEDQCETQETGHLILAISEEMNDIDQELQIGSKDRLVPEVVETRETIDNHIIQSTRVLQEITRDHKPDLLVSTRWKDIKKRCRTKDQTQKQ